LIVRIILIKNRRISGRLKNNIYIACEHCNLKKGNKLLKKEIGK